MSGAAGWLCHFIPCAYRLQKIRLYCIGNKFNDWNNHRITELAIKLGIRDIL